VVLEVAPEFRNRPETLQQLYVRANASYTTLSSASASNANASKAINAAATAATSASNMVPLSAVASMSTTTAPLVVTHADQLSAVTLSFNLGQGASLGDALNAIAEVEQQLDIPNTIQARYTGTAAEFKTSLASEPWLILAAVVVIYIVLGVLYESYIHPITILSTLPSAGVGALLALILTGQELSIVALIGIILLIGIVKKN